MKLSGLSLATALTLILSATSAWAQSLKPEAPSPLQPGINKGTVDNMIGTQYWYFTGGPGSTVVKAQFTAMGLLGNPYKSAITVTLYDEAHTWKTPKILSTDSKMVDCTFTADLKKPTKICISVAPPPNGLVRMGGDYQLEATGAISYGQKSNVDPIIGTYNQMGGYTSMLGATKFLADGTVETASGANGNWKLFDEGTQTYVVNIEGQERHSLQFRPGRGLCDGDFVIFQQLR